MRPPFVLNSQYPLLRFTTMASPSDKASTDSTSVSPSSAIDFLTLCHSLKVCTPHSVSFHVFLLMSFLCLFFDRLRRGQGGLRGMLMPLNPLLIICTGWGLWLSFLLICPVWIGTSEYFYGFSSLFVLGFVFVGVL